uniref:Syntrophin gamma 1 n=1 Tax=Taeniopygia guttata TaxID=59729 RepID=A0A674GC53_TAEGU
MDFRTTCEETKTGVCLLQDGNQEPFKVRLHLAKDILMIQEQDVICVSGEPFYSGSLLAACMTPLCLPPSVSSTDAEEGGFPVDQACCSPPLLPTSPSCTRS